MLTQVTDVLKAILTIIIYLNVLPFSQIQHQRVAINTKPFHKSYDFIIIGAGSAGCVLASRLTENSDVTVLLLEAGESEDIETDIPTLTEFDTKHNWNYEVDGLGKAFINNENGRGYLPRGKVMGGSSAINSLIYMRGSPRVYDDWMKMGLSNWSWNDVLPYFIKSERNLDHDYDNGYHGTDGPWIVSSSGKDFGPFQTYLDAAEEFGLKKGVDLNGPQQIGCNIAQRNIDYGVRVSLSRAYLEPIAHLRTNLDIRTSAFVIKILFKNQRAIGVQFDYNGEKHVIESNKEVIVSAGTVNSPQILMLSGVGPKKELEKHNIKLVADVPGVGRNVHDHVYVLLPNFVVNKDPLVTGFSPLFYIYVGLATNVCQVNSSINEDDNYFDLQFNTFYVPLMDPFGEAPKSLFGLKKNAFYYYFGPYIFKPYYLTVMINLRPKSRGWIKLKSNNPYEYPIIQPNYLKHPDDVKVVMDAVKMTYQVGRTKTFSRRGVKVFETKVLGCQQKFSKTYEQKYGYPNEEYLECAVRRQSATGYHISGSCKMGPNGDPMAVVDDELRVKGIDGLRVIDASIIPVIPNANTNAVVVMIAEKAADIIKNNYGL